VAKSFLRSGSLNDILALGENGQPVYASALQLRETLRLRKQPAIADCLAIPQLNEAGDRLDWYSPREGKVVSWAAATDSARASALRQLENCLNVVAQIGNTAKSSEKPANQFFGSLLEKAFRFPDQNHVYLVGGQPVITFWGFVNFDSASNTDAFASLRNTLTADEPLPTLSLAAEKVKAPEPVVAPEEPVKVIRTVEARAAEQEIAAPEPVAPPRRKISPLIWALPVAALVVAGSAAGWLYSRTPAPKVETAKAKAPEPAPVAEPAPVVIAPPPVAAEVKAPVAATPEPAKLPVAPAAVVPSPEPVAEVEKTPVVAEPVAAPVSKNALVMPPDAVKIGSTKFLNGNWNVIVDIKDPVTGKPPVLHYQIKQGQGTVKITYGAGITCHAAMSAGLMQSGKLVINSRYKAKCSDGSRYQMPEISCTQGATGAAVCQGRYTGDTVYPMTIKREGK